ncbi:MAG: Hsp70 family protein [Gammaproteobacteria bacterium]
MNYLTYYSLAGILILLLFLWVWLARLQPLPPRNAKTPLSKYGATADINFSDWLILQACEQTGADLSEDPSAMMRLREASQKAIAELSRSGETLVDLPFLYADASGPKHFKLEVTRDRIEGIKLQ